MWNGLFDRRLSNKWLSYEILTLNATNDQAGVWLLQERCVPKVMLISVFISCGILHDSSLGNRTSPYHKSYVSRLVITIYGWSNAQLWASIKNGWDRRGKEFLNIFSRIFVLKSFARKVKNKQWCTWSKFCVVTKLSRAAPWAIRWHHGRHAT